ncbi:hypothetical protein [Anaerococcus urinomassiliensis]|uniref:hypothetical protein n=1 Tax=Anaerococcus urinomassiliensis TaxID=1745712 RepID=UPI000A4F6AC6|nr:hypothetical protein [Anaerococcus urinomassiliensis]
MNIEKTKQYTKLIFPNDKNNNNLKLLVTLSPIFIASFDSGKNELEYLSKTIEKSKFPYGLYPNFFADFDIDDYKKAYKNYQVEEDIYLNEQNNIEFRINPIDHKYLDSLIILIETIILDEKSNEHFTKYFAQMRDDIVRNGRRSILANGIQGFYLSKYVVVWMLDLCQYVMDHHPEKKEHIRPIYNLANTLKIPSSI